MFYPVNRIMDVGQFYEKNLKRLIALSDNDWRIAIKKCKTHLQWKLKKKTLYGAHTSTNLGSDPIEYYINLGTDKILSGEWEWKSQFSLSQQLIRIVDSAISKEVEKIGTKKAAELKIEYTDDLEFYDFEDIQNHDSEQEYQQRIELIGKAVKGDNQLEEMWDCIKNLYKRSEIAELMGLTPKQFDKLKERFIEKVRKYQPGKS